MLLLLTILLLLISLAQANHSVCGWTGPGPGDPTKYNFTLYCWANRIEILSVKEGHPDRARYVCDHRRVADWNYLRGDPTHVLELGTPCNGGGWARKGRHCPAENWSACLANNSVTAAITQCYYYTAYNDCEWPGTFTIDSLPRFLGIFSL